jgi:hypothetical protein
LILNCSGRINSENCVNLGIGSAGVMRVGFRNTSTG